MFVRWSWAAMRVSGTNWPPYLPNRPSSSGTSRWIGGVRFIVEEALESWYLML